MPSVSQPLAAPLASTLAEPLSEQLSAGGDLGGQSAVRPVIVNSGSANWDILLNGVSMRKNGGKFHGMNWGAHGSHGGLDRTNNLGVGYGANPPYVFPTTIASAVAEAVADGVQHVRTVGYSRWRGQYNHSPGADGEDDAAYAETSPYNVKNLDDIVTALTNAGIWVTITGESDCGQAGTQDNGTKTFCGAFAGAGEVPMIMHDDGSWTVDPLNTFTLAGGYNYFTSPVMFARFREWWLMIARKYRSVPYIFAYELLSEPLPSGGFTYDATWSPRIQSLFRVLIKAIRQIDTVTPFVVGGRNSYNLSPEMGEMLLTERTDCIYTWDQLSGTSKPPNHVKQPWRAGTALAYKVPLYMNQYGTQTVDDPNQYGLNAGWVTFKSYGIPCIWWQARDAIGGSPDSTGYGLRYSTDNGVTWIDKTAVITPTRQWLAATVTSLQAAATTAINGATNGAAFWFTQPDGSGNIANAFTDAGTTQAKVGQALQQWNANLGGANLANFVQATALNKPTINATSVSDKLSGSGDIGTVDAFPGILFDGTNAIMNGATAFYTLGTEDQTVIVAGIPYNFTGMDFFMCGNAGASQLYPELGLNSAQVARARWSDGTTNYDCIGTTDFSGASTYTPCVLTATKSGDTKKLFVNGLQEGSTNSTHIAGAVTPTRIRIGGDTTNHPNLHGTIGFVFVCKNALSDANRQAIERFAAYLVGAPYQF